MISSALATKTLDTSNVRRNQKSSRLNQSTATPEKFMGHAPNEAKSDRADFINSFKKAFKLNAVA